MPLADALRPRTLDDIVGQKHILAPGSVLRNIIEQKAPMNLIFYGPPGTGKTTLANIIADSSNRKFYKLNAVNAGLAEIKDILKKNTDPVLIYLDEIQYFNKKQQQSLLEVMESGAVQLIASTTENPYFYVYKALLSRSSVFEFKPITPDDLLPAINKALDHTCSEKNLTYDIEIPKLIAMASGGDARKAITTVELLTNAMPRNGHIPTEQIEQLSKDNSMRYDKGGEETYDLASALMKSMRGSDPNAALHYLARFLAAGDMITPIRRILCSASEDIGLANPFAPVVAKSCVDTALQLGLPEAQLPLAHAVIYLATSPKSNSAHDAVQAAVQDVQNGLVGPVPRNLQNKHADSTGQKREQGYLYPHNFPYHWIPQQYMPDNLQGKQYYVPGDNQNEMALVEYWQQVYRHHNRYHGNG